MVFNAELWIRPDSLNPDPDPDPELAFKVNPDPYPYILGLPDLDPLVRGTDPDPTPDLGPSIIRKK